MKRYQSILNVTDKAVNVWHCLHGVTVVYKPPGESFGQTLHTIKLHLCRDLNGTLEQRSADQRVWIKGETDKELRVAVGPSFADHPLLTGPRYDLRDVKIIAANRLERDSSGMLILGIGRGTKTAAQITEAKPTRFYRVKGILGAATDNFFATGKVVEKSTFSHVRRHHIDKICASMQSSHQKHMFELCGVHIQSQAAYELAARGPIRPSNDQTPMIYSVKCVEYEPPNFTLEIVCVNEYEMYLKGLIHELGMQVRSTATCTRIQCARVGILTLEHALLKKHWNLADIASNMAVCKNILAENKFMKKALDPVLGEYSNSRQIQLTTATRQRIK